jgi:hypothetical protein
MPIRGSLLGLVGQSQVAGKPWQAVTQPSVYPDPGTYTFTPPINGYFKFVGWGGGGNGSSGVYGGGSGSCVEATRLLTVNQSVTMVVGATHVDTTFTFPDGTVITAGGTTNQAGGIASGINANLGDVGINGTAGPSNGGTAGPGLGTGGGPGGGVNGGAGVPANLPCRGPSGGGAFTTNGYGAGSVNGGTANGGLGFAIVALAKQTP